MSQDPTESAVNDVITLWEEAQAAGREVTIEELCGHDVDLLGLVRQQIAKLRQFDAMLYQSDETVSCVKPPTTLKPGCRVGEFEIVEQIGQGGMGVVYKAKQTTLGDRIVALKVIRSDRLQSASMASLQSKRFSIETSSAAKLDHENLVRIYGTYEYDGLLCYAMQYLNGGDLGQLIQRKPLAGKAAAQLIEPICRAVNLLHENAVIHRDIKPQNILLTSDQRKALVTDFGLARIGKSSELTHDGEVFGSPAYMSPEQATDASAAGVETDIYALGAVLYQCVTGKPPFAADTTWRTIKLVIEDDVVLPRTINSGIDRDLETIILKCLEKHKAHRYGSAADLAEELRRYADNRPIKVGASRSFNGLGAGVNETLPLFRYLPFLLSRSVRFRVSPLGITREKSDSMP